VVGKRATEVIPGMRESNPELFEIYGRVAHSGQPEQFEMYVDMLDRWFEISVYCPEPEHFVAIFDNVTARKRYEANTRKLNEELEQRVQERTAQLTAANKELEAFSYSVSHDLRVPLRSIDGFSQSLLDDYADKLDDEGKRLLHVVRDNARKMGQLINDILAFSRTGRKEMSVAEVDMESLAGAALDGLQQATGGRDLSVEIKPLPPARGDLSMLLQVWVNLLVNAIKFTRPKSPAHIEVGGTAEGEELVYYVKDNGIGFDMQYVDKLFGTFQRLHNADEFEGTGIGLAIVKRIIAKHGGRVWAEGRLNEGATIYFALPNKGES